MRSIEDQWIEYRSKCYPTGLPPQQEVELRQAFYVGVIVAVGMMHDIAKEPENVAVKRLDTLCVEIAGHIDTRLWQIKSRN